MKVFLCSLLCFMCYSSLFSQAPDYNAFLSRNTFFFEAGGKAWEFSLNYERRFILNEKLKMGVQVGFGKNITNLATDPDSLAGDNMIPLGMNLMYGRDRHHIEGGIGTTLKFVQGFSQGKYVYPTISGRLLMMGTVQAGYRYHPPLEGVVIRLNYTGIYQYLNGHPAAGPKYNHWFGASIGIALRNANVK